MQGGNGLGAQCASCMLPILRLGCACPACISRRRALAAAARARCATKAVAPHSDASACTLDRVGARQLQRRSGWSLTGSPAGAIRLQTRLVNACNGHACCWPCDITCACAAARPQLPNHASRPPSPVSSSRLSMSNTVLCCAAGSPSSSCWLKSQSYSLQGKRNRKVCAVARNARKCPLPRLHNRPHLTRRVRLHRLLVDWPSLQVTCPACR